ncbi:type II CRISPR RNA-guided endonuclease Cas9 [Magnetospirillum sp. 15-1]|uniref:type II CRISPR RNA-guided endonuclease Cas9 n=1 Tax=Magnetospirillum sp. 15-1 TaxID=1979370 RepID=UPI000BBBC7D9|nr:type II CRISPR RNA-guided endonuclease Cas9 [Magnetospirillum sp. 15-1]
MNILGLDGGIASIGWAVLDLGEGYGSILGAGTWMFDTPETDKERRPTSEIHREKRGLRRVIRRRRQRMGLILALFSRHGLMSESSRDAPKQPGLGPWELRVAGLGRRLLPLELAVALGHIARHRGFKSTAKQASTSNAAEEGRMKRAMAGTL